MDYPEYIECGGRKYDVLYRNGKGMSSSVGIKGGAVKVSLSRFLRGRRRDETLEKFLNWAIKKLAKADGSSFIEPVYEDGGRVVTHNRIYEINVFREDRKNVGSKIVDGFMINIYLPLGIVDEMKESVVRDLSEKLVMKDQLEYLKETINELNELYFKENVAGVRFKRTKSRFGSCSSKKNINIALKLLFAPREVFRYVCVHELSHLKQMNHSRKFWALVAEACPDYKQHEKWLRENGFLLG